MVLPPPYHRHDQIQVVERDPLIGLNSLSTEHPTTKKVPGFVLIYVFSYSVIISFYFTFVTAMAPVWFHLHPFLLSFGSYSLACYAISLKKDNKTKQHGRFMVLSSIISVFGVLLAYQDKNARGKQHFLSTHAVLGLVSTLCFLVYTVISYIFLLPESQCLIRNQRFRKVHRFLGRIIVMTNLIVIILGIYKYEKSRLRLICWVLGLFPPCWWIFV